MRKSPVLGYDITLMPVIPVETLKRGASKLGIELGSSQLDQFDAFASMLLEANKRFNLTRITDPLDIVTKHFLDSLMCLSVVEQKPGSAVVDIGTGAGFPGIPIKIARPDVTLTLVDSTMKKIRFAAAVAKELGLDNVFVVHARAEELAHNTEYREQFDAAYARALAEMRILAELCLPFVRVGGTLVATKGPAGEAEIAEAEEVIHQLGATIEKTVSACIPETEIRRTLVVARKQTPTPKRYPRPYSQIAASRTRSQRD
ncbi:MAG: 16S rRNA (guanine(527)-N(7))-methyltransferase RsmG [Armatimonadota bacterium]|nr:16S rRNA (guanine(527)-N(7))-methyltransferase RsmG [Armatimonadota bacterium]